MSDPEPVVENGEALFGRMITDTRAAIKRFWDEQNKLQLELGLVDRDVKPLTDADIDTLAAALTNQLVIRNMSLIAAGTNDSESLQGGSGTGAGAGAGQGRRSNRRSRRRNQARG